MSSVRAIAHFRQTRGADHVVRRHTGGQRTVGRLVLDREALHAVRLAGDDEHLFQARGGGQLLGQALQEFRQRGFRALQMDLHAAHRVLHATAQAQAVGQAAQDRPDAQSLDLALQHDLPCGASGGFAGMGMGMGSADGIGWFSGISRADGGPTDSTCAGSVAAHFRAAAAHQQQPPASSNSRRSISS